MDDLQDSSTELRIEQKEHKLRLDARVLYSHDLTRLIPSIC
jgi:hypothetical protein